MRLLATSREPLRVQGEQVVWLPPLPLPDRESGGASAIRSAAVQLFVERVRLQQPDFALGARQVAAIALLCMHLDGIPLALELAAALVPFQSVEEISAHLGDRFKLLTRGSRTALPHQQTLRATLDWSYGLLNDDERRALNRLSIFPGGFSLEAASKVVGDGEIDEFAAVDLLSELVTRSLVVADSTAATTRYRLLETTRAYALGKLADAGETAAIARRHAEYFREFFRDAPDDWLRMSDDGWRAKYLFERDNLRAAIDFALGADGDATLAVALSGMSGPVWPELSLQGEGQSRLEAAAARIGPGVPEPDQARVWHWLGLSWGMASPAKAVEALERAVRLYRRLNDDPRHGWAAARLAHELAVMGRVDEASTILVLSFAELEDAGMPKALGDCYDFSAVVKSMKDDQLGARADLESALALYRDVGAERYATYTLVQLADINWALGELDAAVAGMREAAVRLRNIPHAKVMLGFCLTNLAGVLCRARRARPGARGGARGSPVAHGRGVRLDQCRSARAARCALGRLADAARIAGFADAMTAKKKEAFRQTNEARARKRLEALAHGRTRGGRARPGCSRRARGSARTRLIGSRSCANRARAALPVATGRGRVGLAAPLRRIDIDVPPDRRPNRMRLVVEDPRLRQVIVDPVFHQAPRRVREHQFRHPVEKPRAFGRIRQAVCLVVQLVERRQVEPRVIFLSDVRPYRSCMKFSASG